ARARRNRASACSILLGAASGNQPVIDTTDLLVENIRNTGHVDNLRGGVDASHEIRPPGADIIVRSIVQSQQGQLLRVPVSQALEEMLPHRIARIFPAR